jgi:hypothetical protein
VLSPNGSNRIMVREERETSGGDPSSQLAQGGPTASKYIFDRTGSEGGTGGDTSSAEPWTAFGISRRYWYANRSRYRERCRFAT